MKKDLSVSMVEANIYALVVVLPFIIPFFGLYVYIWGWHNLLNIYNLHFVNFILYPLAIMVGIVLHEIIHGLSWQFFANKRFNTIKYGIDSKTLSPYAHCQEPMKVKPYRLGVIMPGILLGFLPTILGTITGNSLIFVFGLFFILAAGGDLFILWLLRKVKAGSLVEDHPTRAGCYVISSRNSKI